MFRQMVASGQNGVLRANLGPAFYHWLLGKISPGGGEVDFLADQLSVATCQLAGRDFWVGWLGEAGKTFAPRNT